MIAHRDECDSNLLVDLLHSRLDHSEERHITGHLERCEACRQELELLTAPDTWWLDTQRILKDSRELATPVESTPLPPIGNADAWIVNLLKPSPDKICLGLLDGWPVREVVGQGGMGVVLKVWDEELHRPLAIKLLSPMLASNGAARQRFYREAQAAAAVVHPNIVPIYTVATESSLPYLVMPFVAGGNLQQRIDREGPLPLTEVLSVGVQIAEALVAAHRLGLVHRDIKPANILLDDGGHRVLLSDFGLARTIDDASLTNSGMVVGTPQFMSPEQARGMSIDHRSDLYSLGAVLYAMSTGRPPVRGDSTLEVLRRVSDEQPKPIYDINETLPLWLDRLVQRFLQKRVDMRIASAESAVELMRNALAHARAPVRNSLPRSLRVPVVGLYMRSAAVLGLTLAIVVAGFAFWSNPKNHNVLNNSFQQAVSTPIAESAPVLTPDEWSFDSDIPSRLLFLEEKLREIRSDLQSE